MDQKREVPGLDDEHLARAADACDLSARERIDGGSKVFIVTMPGASADSISIPSSAALRRRAVISTSGSSGTRSG
jgi:hypothetical protein